MKQCWRLVTTLLLLMALPVTGLSENNGLQADIPQAEAGKEMTSVANGSQKDTEAERVRGLIGASREELEAARRKNLELTERRKRLERRLAELRRELMKSDQLRGQLLESALPPEEATTAEQPGEKQRSGQPETVVSPQ